MDELDLMTRNLIVLGAEALAAIVLLALLGGLLKRVLGWVGSSAALKGRFEQGTQAVWRRVRLGLVLLGFLAVAGIGAGNGYLIWRGEDVLRFSLEKLRAVPREFWIGLGIAAGKIAGVVVVTVVTLRIVRRVLASLGRRAKAYEGIKANDESIELFFGGLARTCARGAWIGVLAISLWLVELPVAAALVSTALRVYLIASAGLLCWRAVGALIDSLEALSAKYSEKRGLLAHYEKLKPLVPLLRRALEYVLFVSVASFAALQVEMTASLAEWWPKLVKVIGLVFLSRIGVAVANLVIEEFMLNRAKLTAEQRQRRLTIVPLVRSALKYGVYFWVGVMILEEFGADPTPILAGAGILAMAVGFGAQNLINDVVSGFFILFENYYLVGDFVHVGDAEGTVEAIDLRTTRIRDGAGRQHIIRNGNVGDIINYSKTYIFAVVEVGIAYEADLNKAQAALTRVGQELCEANADVLQPTDVLGVVAFGESELTLRTTTRVRPGKHLSVERELRRRIKEAFDADGVEIPYAKRVLILKQPVALQPVGA
ncbi:MAG: mechanosensitive ion channel family protein [Planctomycetes bacterium]|nr:mechanosensitive ion channel family protein [Planctomycetota bacterium]